MVNPKSLFNNLKQCKNCQRPLPLDYKEDLCPHCIESQLFYSVKEYIRENNVNEYQVAEHFGIPLKQVKSWIREGRIEYRTGESNTMMGLHCQRCGSPVNFGSQCPKCLQLMNGKKGYATGLNSSDTSKMHYLDNKEE